MAITAIKTTIATWQAQGAVGGLERIHGYSPLHPITLIRRALAACPDEFPASGTGELNFILDADLRESLRIDISAMNQALSNGQWKAATVLAGSIVEALLLWVLSQKDPNDRLRAITNLISQKVLGKNPPANLEEWNLHQYVEVAQELQVISSTTADQTRIAKDFRNLIHPGRSMRLGQTCNRGTALSAVAAVEHVVQDLSP